MNLIVMLIAVVISLAFTAGGLIYIKYRLSEKADFNIEAIKLFALKKKTIIYFVFSVAVSLIIFIIGNVYGLTMLQCYRNLIMVIWIIPIAYFDYRNQIIPNFFILIGLVFWIALFLFEIFLGGTNWLSTLKFSLFGLLIGGGVLLLCLLISRKSIGMGDVKMFSVIGLIYGFNNTFTIMMISLLIMAAVGIFLMIRKKADRKSTLPMAPFLMMGLIISCLLGI